MAVLKVTMYNFDYDVQGDSPLSLIAVLDRVWFFTR